MSPRTTRAMTVSRQVLATLAMSLAVMIVLIAIAVGALQRVTNIKDRVIERESRLVSDAYRLDLAVAERGVAVRNFLLTNKDSYLRALEAADERYDDAMAALRERAHTEAGRDLLDEITAAAEHLRSDTATILQDRRDGRLPLEEVPPVIESRLTPNRQAVTQGTERLILLEEQLIERAMSESNDSANAAERTLLALGAAGILATVLIGARVTRGVTRRLTGLALSVDSAAAEILAGTAQQVAGASRQAAAVQETVATADELAQTAEQSAERARTVADRANLSAEVAGTGTAAVADSATTMEDIRTQVESIASTVVSLAERAQAISGIVRTVEDIAEQVHLLALNAAIEAARAGDHGRGFAVVAGEIRALADQSKQATVQIAEILGHIQQGTNSAVMATEAGGKSVGAGVERITLTGTTIQELADTASSAAVAAEQISASSGQQAAATVQISQAMRDLDDVAQQSAAAARQAEQAARDLNAIAADLKALVGVG